MWPEDADCTWLLAELDADGLAFGLCDLGLGEPELGYVSLFELRTVRGKLGLPIERDEHFQAGKTLCLRRRRPRPRAYRHLAATSGASSEAPEFSKNVQMDYS